MSVKYPSYQEFYNLLTVDHPLQLRNAPLQTRLNALGSQVIFPVGAGEQQRKGDFFMMPDNLTSVSWGNVLKDYKEYLCMVKEDGERRLLMYLWGHFFTTSRKDRGMWTHYHIPPGEQQHSSSLSFLDQNSAQSHHSIETTFSLSSDLSSSSSSPTIPQDLKTHNEWNVLKTTEGFQVEFFIVDAEMIRRTASHSAAYSNQWEHFFRCFDLLALNDTTLAQKPFSLRQKSLCKLLQSVKEQSRSGHHIHTLFPKKFVPLVDLQTHILSKTHKEQPPPDFRYDESFLHTQHVGLDAGVTHEALLFTKSAEDCADEDYYGAGPDEMQEQQIQMSAPLKAPVLKTFDDPEQGISIPIDGLILIRADSKYEPGTSPWLLKYKWFPTLDLCALSVGDGREVLFGVAFPFTAPEVGSSFVLADADSQGYEEEAVFDRVHIGGTLSKSIHAYFKEDKEENNDDESTSKADECDGKVTMSVGKKKGKDKKKNQPRQKQPAPLKKAKTKPRPRPTPKSKSKPKPKRQ